MLLLLLSRLGIICCGCVLCRWAASVQAPNRRPRELVGAMAGLVWATYGRHCALDGVRRRPLSLHFCCSPRYRLDWYLSAPCGSPSCASRGCRVLGDVSRSVGPVSVPTRLATGVLMRVHLCVFVPCTSSRLVSSVIVFSGNWRCAPALPQLAASEPAGVPSRRGIVCCAACAEGLWLVSCARCHASDEINKGPPPAALKIEQNGCTPELRNCCSRVSQCCQSYPTATTSRRETTRQPPNTRVTRVRKNPGQ